MLTENRHSLVVDVELTQANPCSSQGQAATPSERPRSRCSNAAACPALDAGSVDRRRSGPTAPTTRATSSGTCAAWASSHTSLRTKQADEARSTGVSRDTPATARVSAGASLSRRCSAGSRRTARAASCATWAGPQQTLVRTDRCRPQPHPPGQHRGGRRLAELRRDSSWSRHRIQDRTLRPTGPTGCPGSTSDQPSCEGRSGFAYRWFSSLLVVFNCSNGPSSFQPSKGEPADDPPRVVYGGKTYYLIAVDVGTDRSSASKESPANRSEISFEELIASAP